MVAANYLRSQSSLFEVLIALSLNITYDCYSLDTLESNPGSITK